jgi:hypothetical protein
MRTHQQEGLTREEPLMGATKPKPAKWQTLKFKRRPRKLSKRSDTSWPETMDGDESVEAKKLDRLLMSSLKFWEVERDLIEERITAMGR